MPLCLTVLQHTDDLVSITFSLRSDKVALELTLQKLVLKNIAVSFMQYWILSYSLINKQKSSLFRGVFCKMHPS